MVKLRTYKKFSNNQMNGGMLGRSGAPRPNSAISGITKKGRVIIKYRDKFFKTSHYFAILTCIVIIIYIAIWSFGSDYNDEKPYYYGKQFNVENPYGYNIKADEANSRIGIITTSSKYRCGNDLSNPNYQCINDKVISNKNIKDCCGGDDANNGNCNVLYDVLTKEKGSCRGMKGVETILDQINDQTNLKNQIKYLLCQQAKQNVFSYNQTSAGANPVLTWDGILLLNGWDKTTYNNDKLTIKNGRFVFYMTCIIALWCPFVGLLWKITSSMMNINKHNIFTTLVEYSVFGKIIDSENISYAYINIVIFIFSFLIYWMFCIVFLNSILGIKQTSNKDQHIDGISALTWGSNSINYVPLIAAVAIWISIFVTTLLNIKKGSKDSLYGNWGIWIVGTNWPMKCLWVIIISLLVWYFTCVAKAASNFKDVSVQIKGDETGLVWPSPTEEEAKHVKDGIVNVSDYTNPIYAVPKALLGLFIATFICFVIYTMYYNDKEPNTISLIKKKSPRNILKQFGAIFLVNIAFILHGFNWFASIFYPQVYIVLMVIQRLIFTNLIFKNNLELNNFKASFKDNFKDISITETRDINPDNPDNILRNWDYILNPLINELIKNFYNEDINILEKRNNPSKSGGGNKRKYNRKSKKMKGGAAANSPTSTTIPTSTPNPANSPTTTPTLTPSPANSSETVPQQVPANTSATAPPITQPPTQLTPQVPSANTSANTSATAPPITQPLTQLTPSATGTTPPPALNAVSARSTNPRKRYGLMNERAFGSIAYELNQTTQPNVLNTRSDITGVDAPAPASAGGSKKKKAKGKGKGKGKRTKSKSKSKSKKNINRYGASNDIVFGSIR